MNWQHLTAFLWLRWRLLANQWRRAGAFNNVVMMILAVGALLLAVPLGIGCFVAGYYEFPQAAPVHLLYVWDVVVVAFLFCWAIGLLTELQRSESLSLSKFLHLPVSVNGAFLINYASSLLRLTLIVFLPVMLGLCLALVVTKGLGLLLALPLAAAFLLMVTAVTYQFQGWLASLMGNPRRRRTVVVVTTTLFIVLMQLPNLLNFAGFWGPQKRADQSTKLVQELAKLERSFQSHEFDSVEHVRRQQEVMQRHQQITQKSERDGLAHLERTARLMNLLLPVGWLPLGVMGAAEGSVVPAVLGILGMTLIGTASLWRAHVTTIRIYQGVFTGRQGSPATVTVSAASPRKAGVLLVERRLAGLSEPVAVIALGGLRSLLRAPEVKMMFLTPLLMGAIFGSTLFNARLQIPVSVRPWIAIGGMILVLMGMLQIMANQFGFDRDGFRVFLLCAAPRRDILLGKNLAFVPLALGMAASLILVVQVVLPMRVDHVLAMFPQFVSMFLLFCLLANLVSIYSPMHIPAGALRPTNPKLIPILLQLVMIFCLFPMSQAPTLIPWGIEAALEWQGWTKGVPICLALSLAECAVIVWLYRFCLKWQGDLLQSREQKILETVTGRAP